MKRKRGKKKKGKVKGPIPSATMETDEAVVNLISLCREVDDDNGNDTSNDDDRNDELRSPIEINTPSSTGTDQPLNLASINADGSINNKATTVKSVGRVKVKLKASSSSKSQSDTDKSSPAQLSLEKQGVMVKMADGEVGGVCSGNMTKKPGSIKIKPALMVVNGGPSGEKSGKVILVAQDESLQRKEMRKSQQKCRYNKQELDSALMVIKKVMKMDAAEPFNVPVNPEALGIPDYFDVIETPMDFGTICSNLERGDKYLNSEDVYKDVKCIWDNCYKYNNKGDYILDLMKRVKKNFMKYWTGAGLFTEQPRGANDAEGCLGDDVITSNQDHLKSSQSKKTKKRHGRRHKSDCLCAICVLKRRRKEREENERRAQGQVGFIDNKLAQQLKKEASTLVESPGGEESSSNMGESLDPDTDIEVEGKGEVSEGQYSPVVEKQEEVEEDEGEEGEEEEEEEEVENEVEIQKEERHETPKQSADIAIEEHNGQPQPGTAQDTNVVMQMHSLKGHTSLQLEEETMAVLLNKRKLQELQERQQKAKMFKKFHVENPLLLSLCETLFPEKGKSVWTGPHSLAKRQSCARRSSIHAAVEALMK